jgi:hypothetical protein
VTVIGAPLALLSAGIVPGVTSRTPRVKSHGTSKKYVPDNRSAPDGVVVLAGSLASTRPFGSTRRIRPGGSDSLQPTSEYFAGACSARSTCKKAPRMPACTSGSTGENHVRSAESSSKRSGWEKFCARSTSTRVRDSFRAADTFEPLRGRYSASGERVTRRPVRSDSSWVLPASITSKPTLAARGTDSAQWFQPAE